MQRIDTTLEDMRIVRARCAGGTMYEGDETELLRLAAMSGLDRVKVPGDEVCDTTATHRFYLDGMKVAALVDGGLFAFSEGRISP